MSKDKEVFVVYVPGPDVSVYLDPFYNHLLFYRGKGQGKLVVAATLESVEHVCQQARAKLVQCSDATNVGV